VASVDGISVTGHMHSLVCLGEGGASARLAIVLGDRRGMSEAAEITDALDQERIYTLTGTRMDASMPAAKLRWLAAHGPEIHS
jgi:xylulokinase